MGRGSLALVLALLSLTGCPSEPPGDPWDPLDTEPYNREIGTWPTPEASTDGCDGLDNDGNGAVDEGCACTEPRSCVLMANAECSLGTQACESEPGVRGLVQQGCAPLNPAPAPFAQAVPAAVEVDTVAPAPWGPNEPLRVEARVTVPCAGVEIPYVRIEAVAQAPLMRIWAWAWDDGVAPDATANDGLFTAELPGALGPGVRPQSVTVRASAVIEQSVVSGSAQIEWLGVPGSGGWGGSGGAGGAGGTGGTGGTDGTAGSGG